MCYNCRSPIKISFIDGRKLRSITSSENETKSGVSSHGLSSSRTWSTRAATVTSSRACSCCRISCCSGPAHQRCLSGGAAAGRGNSGIPQERRRAEKSPSCKEACVHSRRSVWTCTWYCKTCVFHAMKTGCCGHRPHPALLYWPLALAQMAQHSTVASVQRLPAYSNRATLNRLVASLAFLEKNYFFSNY